MKPNRGTAWQAEARPIALGPAQPRMGYYGAPMLVGRSTPAETGRSLPTDSGGPAQATSSALNGASGESAPSRVRFSIIIPVKAIGDYVREAIPAFAAQAEQDFEILILPDHASGEIFPKARIIPTAPYTRPADKRDIGAREARGEFLAFIDDDAYPAESWLAAALPHFEGDPKVAGVCGPGVTPPGAGARERASGWVMASKLGSWHYTYRFVPERARDVDDYPSMNLIVRRSDFLEAGGFDVHVWPGEDTALCEKLTGEMGKRIVYDPDVLVFHHRRDLYVPHLRQHARFGTHRGRYAAGGRKTSLRPGYFLPTALLLAILLAPTALILPRWLGILLLLGPATYALLLIATAGWVYTRDRSLKVALLSASGIVATHLVYGVAFVWGLATPRRAISRSRNALAVFAPSGSEAVSQVRSYE
jgi:hypothetical protein